MGLILDVQDGNHGERHPKIADFTEDGISFVTANCIRNGRLRLEEAYRLHSNWLRILRVGFAQPGDLLLTHKGTVGEVAVVPETVDRVILSPQVTYYRIGPDLDALFLMNTFRAPSYQSLLSQTAQQSTRAYIGLLRQRQLPIIVPPIAAQRDFSRMASKVTGAAEQRRTQLREFDALFASLQSRAFSGQL